ncbi:MAG: hypothetical protein R2867_22140 [Caldilineaceae bacterium]
MAAPAGDAPVAVIHADAVYSDGAIQSIGGLPEGAVPGLPIALPSNVNGIRQPRRQYY